MSAQALHRNNEAFLALAETRLRQARTETAADVEARKKAIEDLLAPMAKTLERVDALAFEGSELLGACNADTNFGYTLMQRLLAVVAERLQATRLQLLDTYSPIAARAGA